MRGRGCYCLFFLFFFFREMRSSPYNAQVSKVCCCLDIANSQNWIILQLHTSFSLPSLFKIFLLTNIPSLSLCFPFHFKAMGGLDTWFTGLTPNSRWKVCCSRSVETWACRRCSQLASMMEARLEISGFGVYDVQTTWRGIWLYSYQEATLLAWRGS